MYELINTDCLDYLVKCNRQWDTIFADPPDNIGTQYQQYKDRLPDSIYEKLLGKWIRLCIARSNTTWLSFNSKWIFVVGRIVHEIVSDSISGLQAKMCVQTFTFGQHNHHDLGNNHRPLLRLRWPNACLLANAVRVPSWRQQHGDKRADPRGRVPGDVYHSEGYNRDILPLPQLNDKDILRFLSKVDRRGEDECWEWLAAKREGYGRFRVGDSLYVATRIMWRLTHGIDPIGQLILHTCDNPGCCNPAHLFIGSDYDNNVDKELKHRGKHPIGESNGLAKLKDDDVRTIYLSIEKSAELARQYGVSDVAINCIREGKTWQHVTSDLAASDVFNFPRVTGNSRQRRGWHPTQLHEGLVERCIRLTTPPGGTVLDPFAGTGTTLRVCNRTGHDCTLIEVDNGYCQQIAAEHGLVIRSGEYAPPTGKPGDLPGQTVMF